jgi:hypothetical protein
MTNIGMGDAWIIAFSGASFCMRESPVPGPVTVEVFFWDPGEDLADFMGYS